MSYPLYTDTLYLLDKSNIAVEMSTVTSSIEVFRDDTDIQPILLGGKLKKMLGYIPWGSDNELPYKLMSLIGDDEVMSQNQLFNTITCYGSGLRYVDKDGNPSKNKEIKTFFIRNNMPLLMLEQITDMKYFFFTICVFVLSKNRTKIVQMRHKEACYCRFEKADKYGKINHIFYANWRKNPGEKDIECIPLLDLYDPIGDLMVRTGREAGADGIKKIRDKSYKFAMFCKFPTPDSLYYPVPYYASFFKGDWYDIKHLIAKGKKAKISNHASIKYHVEIHKDFWTNLFAEERITDETEKVARIKKEKERIRDFCSGVENSNKLWISGFYVDPMGKEQRMVRINVIDSSKEGGDWSDDIQEASNMACYTMNVHPNLVGATPGKSGMNNSGSDKRELYTIKQSLEKAYHDIMAMPHYLLIEFNGWGDLNPEIPMIQLTLLSEGKDAKEVTTNSNDNDNNTK